MAGNARRPHFVLISLDATRWDAVSGQPGWMKLPFFKDWISRSLELRNAYSTAPWTPPSHASMLTGLYPHAHHVQEGSLWLAKEQETLAGWLGRKGYSTFGISSNPLLGPLTNLDKDFQRFHALWKNPERMAAEPTQLRFDDLILDSRRVFRETSRILDKEFLAWQGEPLFCMIQLIGPHSPYQPSSESLETAVQPAEASVLRHVERINRDWRLHYGGNRQLSSAEIRLLRELYQAELLDLDRGLQWIFSHPFFQEILPQAHVIMTADHGEMLGEKGHIHHLFNLYEPLIHVPFFWKAPRLPKEGRLDVLFDHASIFPAIRQVLDGEGGGDTLRSTSPEMTARGVRRTAVLLHGLQRSAPGGGVPFRHDSVALRWDTFKFIWKSNGQHEAFNLSRDPAEEHPIPWKDLSAGERLPARAQQYLGGRGRENLLNHLSSLGYY